MKTFLSMVVLSTACHGVWGQTAADLLGRWQLVGLVDPAGQALNIERELGTREVFQVFTAPDVFEGVVGEQRARGTWRLSDDNKVLTVTIDGQAVAFRVERLTARSRVISATDWGTLTYERR